MIIVYEDLKDIHGYYHDGIIHINETIPKYLQEHVKDYLEACHRRSPELKVYYMRCLKTDPEIFRDLYKGWDGDVRAYMSDEDIRDIAHRMREQYPEHTVDDDIQMILDIIALCNG